MLNLNYHLITSDEELKLCCEQASSAEYIALDTEFIRTRTYYPKLGLIQLYDGERVTLIDPLTISDWQPFCQLLVNPAVTKLLHASSEDLEVFWHQFALTPQPFIDTQILATFCGYPLSCGYATLILDKLQIKLDKSETRTDWLARPLTDKQCVYAAADVYYLLPLAKILIEETQRLDWYDSALEECNLALQKKTSLLESDDAYLQVNNAWQLNARQLGALQKLAAWRLNYARRKDMSVNFVVKEEHLWKVAQSLPESLQQLEQLGLSGPEIRFHGRTLLDLVAKAKQMPAEQLPKTIVRLVDHADIKRRLKPLRKSCKS
jgi:ribonuclease D